jgi:hypothetical protein
MYHFVEPIFNQVMMTIHSPETLKQFLLEELEAAHLATKDPSNEVAPALKTFVQNSGFSENDFMGAMMRSFDEVDGPGGPQQTLLQNIFSLPLSNPQRALVRVEVVNQVLDIFKGIK